MQSFFGQHNYFDTGTKGFEENGEEVEHGANIDISEVVVADRSEAGSEYVCEGLF